MGNPSTDTIAADFTSGIAANNFISISSRVSGFSSMDNNSNIVYKIFE
ncbi:MAG: hypothetical protein ACTSRI_17855 [Promethearchaeota archaeon]